VFAEVLARRCRVAERPSRANWASSALIPARIKRSTSIAMCDSISAAKSFDERRVHHFQKPQRMAS
jgi:hypothetical protein